MEEGKEFTILVVGNHIPHNLDESSSMYYAEKITEHIKNDITSYYQKKNYTQSQIGIIYSNNSKSRHFKRSIAISYE